MRRSWRGSDTKPVLIYASAHSISIVLELLVGRSSNSLGLFADAFNTLFNCICLFNSLAAVYFSEKRASLEYSYGYERWEVLAAFANSTFLLFVAAFLVTEASHRVYEPPHVHSDNLIWVGCIGLSVNLFGVYIFKRQLLALWRSRNYESRSFTESLASSGGHQINMHTVVLNVFANTISSLSVLLTSCVVHFKGWMVMDSLATLFIAVFIAQSALPLMKQSGRILLQSTPLALKHTLQKIMREAATLEGVLECHEEHFWAMAPGVYVATLCVRARSDADEQAILLEVHKMLSPFITHLTIQVEKDPPIDWFLTDGLTDGLTDAKHLSQPQHPSPVLPAHF